MSIASFNGLTPRTTFPSCNGNNVPFQWRDALLFSSLSIGEIQGLIVARALHVYEQLSLRVPSNSKLHMSRPIRLGRLL